MNQWRITVRMGERVVTITETAPTALGARLSACRYMRALGYSAVPDAISVLRIGDKK